MRATQNVLRAVTVAVIAIGLISLTGACRKRGPLERLGDTADQAVEKAGEAIEDAADKVNEGAQDAVDKAEEVVDDATDTINESPPNASEGASGNTN